MSMDTISAQSMALWLSWPSVLGEFRPAPLAGDSAGSAPALPWPEADLRVTDLRDAFRDSVRSCVGGHETVAVSVSGGLDSLAVLIEAARIAEEDGRRVVATVADLTDDAGGSTLPVVERLVEAAGLGNVEIHSTTIDQAPEGEPDWRPEGPDLDALPLVNRRLAEIASGHGASVMLGGNGADETLGAVRYLLGGYARAAQWSAVRSYWSDSVAIHREALLAEGLALAARLLPRAGRCFLYFAREWPELCTQADAPMILAEPLRGQVSKWSYDWIRDLFLFHTAHHRTWAQAAAWDAVFPLTLLAGPGPIPLRHPFQTPEFITAVQQLPIGRRYDPALPYPYWRQKAQVVNLLPDKVRHALPRAKQTFRAELAGRYTADKTDATCLIDHGILAPAAWRAEDDVLLIGRVNALEHWARQALERGHQITQKPPVTASA